MTTRIGKLNFDPNKIIGRGSFGTFVFKGFYSDSTLGALLFGSGQPVAIKRIQKIHLNESTIQQEVELMQKTGNDHPNILKLFWTEMNADYL